jgi:hypothetical protein
MQSHLPGPSGRAVLGACCLNSSKTGIVGSDPARDMSVCLLSFCVVLSYVGRGLSMDRSPIQGVLPNCLKDLTVSEVNSESEQARGHNHWNVE